MMLKGTLPELVCFKSTPAYSSLFCGRQTGSEGPRVFSFFLSQPTHLCPPAGVGVDSCGSLGESQGPGAAMGRGAPGCMHPAMWVADFFASGWSGGDNDLTCLEEPWTAAGIWDGEGSRGPDREELGAENAPPPGLAEAQHGCLWSGPKAGDRPPLWLAPAQQPLPSHVRRKRVGLTWV